MAPLLAFFGVVAPSPRGPQPPSPDPHSLLIQPEDAWDASSATGAAPRGNLSSSGAHHMSAPGELGSWAWPHPLPRAGALYLTTRRTRHSFRRLSSLLGQFTLRSVPRERNNTFLDTVS